MHLTPLVAKGSLYEPQRFKPHWHLGRCGTERDHQPMKPNLRFYREIESVGTIMISLGGKYLG
jgi:hypothetical protein